jgi:SAM-dependent methyltransferase
MENNINKLDEEKNIQELNISQQDEEFEEHSDSDLNSSQENIVPEFESQLGNKDYWDKFYSQEIKQFENNSDLIGEVWFGEQVQNKEVSYIKDKFSDKNKNIPILDVGCGNAAFILKLANLNFTNLHGMDYSQKSIELAQQILKEKISEKYQFINLYAEDINFPIEKENKFKVIHDKGTFDAFLSNKEHKVESYINFILVNSLPGQETIFILTSCNYSLPELKNMFLFEGSNFEFVENIPHKSFSFGGSAGQVVTTMVFKVKK